LQQAQDMRNSRANPAVNVTLPSECCPADSQPDSLGFPQVPDWFLNRQRDFRDGKTGQIVSSTVDSKLRDDFERLKKIRCAAARCASASGPS